MDSFPWLLLLCLAMLFGSFTAGLIPLAFKFSEKRLQLISCYGSGMLVGTALIVILPEGVETLYSVQASMAESAAVAAAKAISVVAGGSVSAGGGVVESGGISGTAGGHASDTHETAFEAHKYIGAALALGFAFMFLIDHVSHHVGHGKEGNGSRIVTVNDFRVGEEKKSGVNTAVVGLVVHAAADGIALGAASASVSGSLELIVFLAIMLHKAPSAFGLSTYLLSESLPPQKIHNYLALFSLSAPLSALITYMFLVGGGMADDAGATGKWTGILLLFSAGTFLYVATMHILPEVYERGKKSGSREVRLTKGQVGCLMGGIFTPLLLAVEHSH
ncbi:solute carrier family 39, member 9-like protein [Fimicolochytrium jonesii]|uniref:solute carrier family 39, member 9-like protein n=1 Tax=Fimicolochytrium jonesii TaxID=1396493 RepID=UPI0022FDF578|nr:solute carrier family 39, member 9-like protein [Fimicolochytrium jonesii]KAI8826592.1 solute carrier family 39, member 9-like protein [Fimicolochytrium jonesii]